MGDLRSARRGVAIVFFVYGAVLATWVSRIPLVKQELGLDTAQLCLALVGSPVGLILAMQAVAALVDRWTSAVVTRAALVGACVAVVLPGVAWSLGSLAGARTLLGAAADRPAEPDDADPPALRLAQHPGLIALGFVAFCCLFAEGAVDDWSGVYLREEQGASLGVAALGAAAAGAGMAIGRFGGDAVIARFGRPATLWSSSLVAGAGMALAVLAPAPGVAIAAYFVLGLGVATIVPIAFTLAGTQPGVPPAWAISRVTTLGYAGPVRQPADGRPRGPGDEPHRRARDPGRAPAAGRADQPGRIVRSEGRSHVYS